MSVPGKIIHDTKTGRKIFPHGHRVSVTDSAKTRSCHEIFKLLHSKYKSNISRVYCQYEDNGVFRAYYVFQKQSMHCIKADRAHKSTFGQLFLTYGSIKYRCYSNDCHADCFVAFTYPRDLASASDATSRRLLQLRGDLFPELSAAELQRRFPWTFHNAAGEYAGEPSDTSS